MDYDIIIVGAGPAGAMAANYASEQGANVLVVDKKREIGVPVRCGEGIIGPVFDDFGIERNPKWVDNVVTKLKIHFPSGKTVAISLYMDAFILDRVAFERMLISKAIRKGCDLILNKPATGLLTDNTKGNEKVKGIKFGDEIITARIIIGADGVESNVGRWAKMIPPLSPNDIGACLQHTLETIELDAHTAEFYWAYNSIPNSYAWIFPKSDTCANVGLGMFNKTKKYSLQKELDKLISWRCPQGRSIRYTGGCVPLGLPPVTTVKDNIALVGDAARQVNAMTAGGIANALTAGKIAGKIAGELVVKNLPIEYLQEYDKLWRKKFFKRLKFHYTLKNLIGTNRINPQMIEFFLQSIWTVIKFMPKPIFTQYISKMHYSMEKI